MKASESMVSGSRKKLDEGKRNKDDEFYTQMVDIEKEMIYYEEQFNNKIIYCNCDHERSNFWIYFETNFERLGLKRLIATHYNKEKTPYKIELFKENNLLKKHKTQLNGDGDFRSQECIEILCISDVVITNPPFSLFREYVSQLIKYDKKFIIMGNQNAIGYKEIFPLFKDCKLWLGASKYNGAKEFRIPQNDEVRSKKFRKDDDGNKYVRIIGVRWFTNLEHEKKCEFLTLTEKYIPDKYLRYDNCDAIEVNKIKNIPCDYYGVMGVPITFMDKYNPSQFEIIGFRKGKDNKDLRINGKDVYSRILIKRK